MTTDPSQSFDPSPHQTVPNWPLPTTKLSPRMRDQSDATKPAMGPSIEAVPKAQTEAPLESEIETEVAIEPAIEEPG